MSKAFKFGNHIKELRIHLCQTGQSSNGVRKFIESNYVPIKSANPNFPILIRECSGVQPRLWARYEFGRECSVSLKDMNETDVFKQLNNLTQK